MVRQAVMESEPSHYPLTGILEPADAAAVILTDETGRYFVQCRDDIPGIFYPGYVGLFGGAREAGETYQACAVRELREETSLDLTGRLRYFMSSTLSFEPFGMDDVERVFFTAVLTAREIDSAVIAEGRSALCMDGTTLLRRRNVVPYDAFAIWQHLNLAVKAL
jgi:8-oxo-dGTP pyrophosphatase MutT (NUDIX family)